MTQGVLLARMDRGEPVLRERPPSLWFLLLARREIAPVLLPGRRIMPADTPEGVTVQPAYQRMLAARWADASRA